MDLAELARWTPVRLDFSAAIPAVFWADLTGVRFDEPFFDRTVARWAATAAARPLVKTGFDALVALDSEASLEPAGIIFHLSRCGSTLVSRLLGTLPGVVMLNEPAPLNHLLGLGAQRLGGNELVAAARVLVRALGRRRHDDERRLVLKCSSWNIRRRDILAAAFADTPWIWVQRDPARVLASLLARPPGWLGPQARRAARRFGIDEAAVPAMTRAEYAARALGAMLESAAADPAGRLCIDYGDLPSAVWLSVARHFGFDVDAPAVALMAEEARFDAKSLEPRIFTGDLPEQRPLTDEIREAARRFAEPGYRALASHG
ncbi:hypothetical protein [Mycobacterium sp. MUNTM1]